MQNKAEHVAKTVQDCENCDGDHPVTITHFRGHYAVKGELCPEKSLSEGNRTCDRCDAGLSGERALMVTHPDPPKGDYLTVCDRCVEEVNAGATF